MDLATSINDDEEMPNLKGWLILNAFIHSGARFSLANELLDIKQLTVFLRLQLDRQKTY